MRDLARDRKTIGGSLDNISDLTVTVADLLRRGRPLLKRDIAALHDLAKLLNDPDQRSEVVDLLDRMPEVMSDQIRTGTYGSWYQYYVCGCLRPTQPARARRASRSSTRSRTMFSPVRVQVDRAEVSGPMTDQRRAHHATRRHHPGADGGHLGSHLQPVASSRASAAPTYYAEFSDASGIHKGNIVQVGGIRVGRVSDVTLDEDRVIVKFEIDDGDVDFGPDSKASIEVLNLLGEKFLDLQPDAGGPARERRHHPARAHRGRLRHRRRVQRPDDHHRGHRHPAAVRGARRRLRDHRRLGPRDRRGVRRHRAAVAQRLPAGRADPDACSRARSRSPRCSSSAATTSST